LGGRHQDQIGVDLPLSGTSRRHVQGFAGEVDRRPFESGDGRGIHRAGRRALPVFRGRRKTAGVPADTHGRQLRSRVRVGLDRQQSRARDYGPTRCGDARHAVDPVDGPDIAPPRFPHFVCGSVLDRSRQTLTLARASDRPDRARRPGRRWPVCRGSRNTADPPKDHHRS
jgi:hypothetical protein